MEKYHVLYLLELSNVAQCLPGLSHFPKNQKVKTNGKNIMSKITQLKQTSDFYVISEVELYSVMLVGSVLFYSDFCFLRDFLQSHYLDALLQNIYHRLIAHIPKPQSLTKRIGAIQLQAYHF